MLACALLLLGTGVTHAQATPAEKAAQARALQGRLLAPCCWVQTLDVHESELATTLRAEIDQRLARGETGEVIEDDLAARYGERVRAVPRGKDPRMVVPLAVGLAMLATLLGLGFALWRWTRASREVPCATQLSTEKDAYDERLDEELARLGDG